MSHAVANRLDLDACSALARAEAQGAAPGAEWRVDPPPCRPRACSGALRGVMTVAAVLALLGVANLGSAGWLLAKAHVGQWLLSRAWAETRRTGSEVRPWPWADLHPVARLVAPRQGVDVLVLEGANGRALAWGPGHAESSAVPGGQGNAVITGHRDTHFRFLRTLATGDMLVVENVLGRSTSYRVRELRIADHRALRLPAGDRARLLTLVTCYPFDAVAPDTPLRYVVVAEAVDRPRTGI